MSFSTGDIIPTGNDNYFLVKHFLQNKGYFENDELKNKIKNSLLLSIDHPPDVIYFQRIQQYTNNYPIR